MSQHLEERDPIAIIQWRNFLMDGLIEELARNRELLDAYKANNATLGAMVIAAKIKEAEDAIREDDVVRMIHAYRELTESE